MKKKTVSLTLEMLGSHHIVSATIGLAGDDGDLGHGGLSVGVQQLGAVADDSAVLLQARLEESRNKNEKEVSGCHNGEKKGHNK